jgi:hypothetical protein
LFIETHCTVDVDFGGGMVGCSPRHRHLALGRHACHKEFQRQQGRGVVPRRRHLTLELSSLRTNSLGSVVRTQFSVVWRRVKSFGSGQGSKSLESSVWTQHFWVMSPDQLLLGTDTGPTENKNEKQNNSYYYYYCYY